MYLFFLRIKNVKLSFNIANTQMFAPIVVTAKNHDTLVAHNLNQFSLFSKQ